MGNIGKSEKVPQILIVDDVETNLLILENIIEGMGYIPRCASNASEAAALISESRPQLVLLDVFMPEMDGYEFCERLKSNPLTRDIPVIFISAADSSEDKVRGFKLGAVDYIGKPFEVTEVTMRVNNHLKLYEMQKELELSNRRLHSVISSQARRIEDEQKNILYALAALTEQRDSDTANHMENVAYNCRLLAQSLQFSPEFAEDISEGFINTIEVASRLHDIGKLRVPTDDEVEEPGQEGEEKQIRHHAEQGAEILERVYQNTPENSFLPMAVEIARYHHARWDGSGYPGGISGKDIPLSARIAIVADNYDTLTGEEGQAGTYSPQESIQIIIEESGTYFDPDIVDVFVKIRNQLRHSRPAEN
ncbi:MAG: response regulator [Lachnospiraceae bacterium]|nr:response regulator [Lachnospiraceae bacterium]